MTAQANKPVNHKPEINKPEINTPEINTPENKPETQQPENKPVVENDQPIPATPKKERVIKPIFVEAVKAVKELLVSLPTETIFYNHDREVTEIVITGENTFIHDGVSFYGSDKWFKKEHVTETPVLIEVIKGKGKHTAPYNLFSF